MADLLIPKRVGKDKFLLSDFQHDFDEINKEILDLANKDELNKTLADLESNLNQKINKSKEEMASDYNSKINEVEKQVDTNRAELDDLKDEVTFKASKEDVSVVKSEIIDDYNKKFDTINTQIEEEKSQLEVLNDKIELKVEKNELDSLETKLQGEIDSTNGTLDEKIRQNSSAIELLNNEIQLKVTQSDIHNVKTEIQNEFGEQVSTINSTINEQQSSIDMLSEKIELKVESTDLVEVKSEIQNGVDTKIDEMQTIIAQNTASITALSNEITLKVKQETADVATMSDLSLTADALTASFKVNGNNLLLNGRPRKNTHYWYPSYGEGNSGSVTLFNGDCNWNGEVFNSGIWWNGNNVNSNWCCLGNESLSRYKFSVDKTYSVSFIIYAEHELGEKEIMIRISDGNSANTITNHFSYIYGGYQYVNVEFTPDQAGGAPVFMIFVNTLGEYRFFIPWVVVKEGASTKSWIPNGDEINEGSTTINRDGVTIRNGALTIKNNNDENVFYADDSGNLTLKGVVTNGSDTYNTTMDKGGLVFETGGERVVAIRSTKFNDTPSINGVSISAMKNGDYIDLGYTTSDTLDASANFSPYLRIAKTNHSRIGSFSGIQLKESTRLDVGKTIHLLGTSSYTGEIFVNTDNKIAVIGDNGVNIGYKDGDSRLTMLSITEGTGMTAYSQLDMNGYSVKNVGNMGAVEQKATRISNIDAILPCGWYAFGDDASGTRPVNWGLLLSFHVFGEGDVYSKDMCQIVFGTNNSMYTRWWVNGAWVTWKQIA